MPENDLCRECLEAVYSEKLDDVVAALRALVDTGKVGPVDRLGFTLDRRVALEAFTEALRVFNALMNGAEPVRIAGRDRLCCDVFEYERGLCRGVVGVAEDGRYAGRRVCCIPCPRDFPPDEQVKLVIRCIEEATCWRDFTRALVARAIARP